MLYSYHGPNFNGATAHNPRPWKPVRESKVNTDRVQRQASRYVKGETFDTDSASFYALHNAQRTHAMVTNPRQVTHRVGCRLSLCGGVPVRSCSVGNRGWLSVDHRSTRSTWSRRPRNAPGLGHLAIYAVRTTGSTEVASPSDKAAEPGIGVVLLAY